MEQIKETIENSKKIVIKIGSKNRVTSPTTNVVMIKERDVFCFFISYSFSCRMALGDTPQYFLKQ